MRFSFNRKITSYTKVQQYISKLIRCKSFFVNNQRIKSLKFLNVGCGPYPHQEFINLDYHWTPSIDICWDISRKPIPIPSDALEGIYTEHCLEHVTLSACEKSLSEFYRMLKPGGTLRIIVPDGEIYLTIYNRRKNGEQVEMPYEKGYITAMARVNGIFRNYGHQFIYDFETLEKMLLKTGFRNVKKENYGNGRDHRLLIDTDWRAVESLYVEASK
jgi:predicted SAM-dependent methyltransferase